MNFKPSTYQQDILDFFLNNPQSNMLVNALAGSGKSTTACMLSEYSKTSDLYIAFNASVVEEFKKKIKNPKTKVMTMHSLAYSIMLYNVEQESKDSGEKPKGFGSQRSKRTVSLDNFKPHKILDEEITKRYGRYIEFAKRVFLKDNYIKLYNLCRLTLTDMSSNKDVSRLIDDHALFLYYGDEGYSAPDISEITSTLKILDTKSRQQFETQGVIDFTDMLWITFNKLKYDNWEVPYWDLYTNIYVDECQDFSNIQLNFLKFIKRPKGRYIFIGDYHQCQPAGTKISLIDGQTKNIEDLEYGDRIIEYATARGDFMVSERYGRGPTGLRTDNSFRPAPEKNSGEFKGVSSKGNPKVFYEIIDKQRFFTDHLITIETEDGKKSSYTTNHNCLVKFNREKTKDSVCLYLMERYDGIFRIGIVHTYASQTSLGIKNRARSEGFDRCWILNIYDTQKDAWVAEQTYSLKYQIPQIIFQLDKISYNENDIEKIYSATGNIRAHAVALLNEFGRDINYPLWTRENLNSHTARDHCFITQACNIIPNYMDALVFNRKENLKLRKNKNCGHYIGIYSQITKVEHSYGFFPVYGITTSVYHTYVADGIATHNSIYNFAGANAQAFNQIPKMFAPVKTFDLPICYRCAKSHLSRVNREYGIPILPCDDAPMGFVKTIDKSKISEYAKAGDMVISRKNKWVAEVVLDLARNGTPIFIEDKEMVGAIKRQILSSKCTSVGTLEKFLQKVISNYNKKLFEIVSKNAREGGHEEEHLEAVAEANSKIDNTSFLLEILEGYLENHASSDSVSKFSNFIDKLLNTTPSPNCVRLCSIHKAKGLEATNVFVLNEAKINYDFRNSKEQNIQEKNLSYIATTRAKEGLYLVKEPSKTTTTRNTDYLLSDNYLLPDNDVLKKREQDFKKAIVRETMSCF